MGASLNTGNAGGGSRRGRRRSRKAPMSEINVTPMVDVMLVLLIIFMVAAPLLSVGVPLDLPSAKGKQLEAKNKPVVISIKANGDVFIEEASVPMDGLVAKLKAIAENAKSEDTTLMVRGDKGLSYGTTIKVLGLLSSGGFKKITFVTEAEGGG